MTVAGQPIVNYTYNNANRLTQITQGTSTVTFTYDAAGRRTSVTLPNGLTENYTYDAASRLTGIEYWNGTTLLGNLTYTYDPSGNRTKIGGSYARMGLPQPVSSATYNAANQQTNWAGTTLTYDANGNLTNDGSNTYTWDARNRLSSISGPSLSASFQYDAFGRRTSKTINGVSTGFLYDRFNPVQELSGSSPTANMLTGLRVDEYLTRTDAAGTRAFLTDALGSTVALADNTGAVQTEYTYEPFGKVTATGSSSTNPFQYTGRENDGTGLYYYRARYYHPTLQRFASEDPIGFVGGLNLYGYVENNPINFVDPFGLEKCPSFGDSFRFSLNTTNSFFFGFPTNLTRTSIGIATAGATARSFGTVTPFQAIRSLGSGGVANLGIRGTLISAGINTGINAALVAVSLETGIVIGSTINAAFETLTCE